MLWNIAGAVVEDGSKCCGIYQELLWKMELDVVEYSRNCCGRKK